MIEFSRILIRQIEMYMYDTYYPVVNNKQKYNEVNSDILLD